MLTIVAVHGNGGGAARFARVRPFITAPRALRPITLPGCAGLPRDPQLRTLRDYAAFVHERLDDVPRPRVLLGHGSGGAIGLEFVQHWPGAIDGLILHAPVGTRLASRRVHRLMAQPGAARMAQRLLATRALRPLWQRVLFSEPLPQTHVARFFDDIGRCAIFSQMYALISVAWFRSLRPAPIPAALLWGANERILGPDHAPDYQALLPHNMVRIVPGWHHFPMLEHPESYATEITRLATMLVGG
jgi:pimeloyl-ACP methyl ester carboxylesterase